MSGNATEGSSPGANADAAAPMPAPTAAAEGAEIGPIQEAPSASGSPTPIPTQEGPAGARFDFNDGCRIVLPEAEHPWRVRISDTETGNVLFESELKAGRVNSTKRYFVRFRLQLWQQGKSVLDHHYDAAGREVLIRFPVETLGDPLGWFPYAVKFKIRHNCRLTCAMDQRMIDLLSASHPDINFITEEAIESERYYATYTIAVFFLRGGMYEHKDRVPCDYRFVGLHRAAGYILGVDPTESRPHIVLSNDTRPLAEPYVCIASQSTLQSKYWNNPGGWVEIVEFLKEAGYRVICIDLKKIHGKGMVWNHSPDNAEDQTGPQPLMERARWLKHAEFFVGLSSGLSWLAWAMGTPVVMISGLTHPITEFKTPYRVINYHVCNSCWNDVQVVYDRNDYLTCPRHQNTPRQFECTRLITAEQVKGVIRTIPGFGVRRAAE